MQEMIYILFFLPLLFAITLPFTSSRIRYLITFMYVVFLVFITVQVVFTGGNITASFSSNFHLLFTSIDFLVLGYFVYQGIKFKHKLVITFAITQIVLFIIVLQIPQTLNSYDILIDYLAKVMLLVVNAVGGIIILYALKYVQKEDLKVCRKGFFIGMLFFFIGVMNFLITTNNIKLFFLAFELTTLCSYILIKFRLDEVAIKNALQALWINQIGGVAILVALILSLYTYKSYSFNILIENSAGVYLAPMAFLVIAALVKGASLPFERWLLGAMVAPTPVSAILHSATMVKIAPFLILKTVPAFSSSFSLTVTLFGSFVFFVASLITLSRDLFKEIIGISTIALLALMASIAAIGTKESFEIVIILIVFHAISKALLFFQEGILEKEFHLKYLSDIDGLASYSKAVVVFILIGFASLSLPPFGIFIGKFNVIEMFAKLMEINSLYIIPLVFLLIGSVVLILLYFKVFTKLLPKASIKIEEYVSIPLSYILTSSLLVCLLLFGIYQLYTINIISLYEVLIPFGIILLSILLLIFNNYTKAYRVKEYNCGYFHINDKYRKALHYSTIVFLAVIILVGVI